LIVTAAAGAAIITGLTAASAAVYDAVAEKDGVTGFDRPTLELAMRLRTPLSDRVITIFTEIGSPRNMAILAGCVTLVMAWRWRSAMPMILMAVAVAGSLTFSIVGKQIVRRGRPPLVDAVPPYEYAFSFPSGHTLNSTVIAGMVAYLVARRLSSRAGQVLCVVAATMWAVAMGLSRVFLGHHWLTDVAFSWLLGLAWLALLITMHRLYLVVRPTSRLA
jgi:undecaprenyl-diphosphatase